MGCGHDRSAHGRASPGGHQTCADHRLICTLGELLDEDGIDRKQERADRDQTTTNPRTGEQQKDKA